MDLRTLATKDWSKYPKFRHNLWANYDDEPAVTYLTVSHSKFAVDRDDAEAFLRMRPHCTGHHTVDEIVDRSGLEETRVKSILSTLAEAKVTRPSYKPIDSMSDEEIRAILFDACRIWGEQLAETYIAADISAGREKRSVLNGWMLETYHYIRCFPAAVAHAAKHAGGELQPVLAEYARQETGHEKYILECLVNLGFKRAEVEESVPLVSTRLIDHLMRELFERAPAAALLLASIVEAGDVAVDDVGQFCAAIAEHYGLAPDTLLPYRKHVLIDAELGHGKLAERHAELISFPDEATVHFVCNQLHDIKHAFDVQSLEIREYYTHNGNYVPRQYVDFFAI